jgi:hypothetical protein
LPHTHTTTCTAAKRKAKQNQASVAPAPKRQKQTKKKVALGKQLQKHQEAVDKFIKENNLIDGVGQGDIGATLCAETLLPLLKAALKLCFPDGTKMGDLTLLDLGCSSAQLIVSLSLTFRQVGGVEYQESLLKAALKVSQHFGECARIWPADILHMGGVRNVDILFSW